MRQKLDESVDLLDLEQPTPQAGGKMGPPQNYATKQQRLEIILQAVSHAFWMADSAGEELEISLRRSRREFDHVDGVLECLKEGIAENPDVIMAPEGPRLRATRG